MYCVLRNFVYCKSFKNDILDFFMSCVECFGCFNVC